MLMLASTSRAVLRTTLGAPAFSTSATAQGRRVVVELLEDVSGLGQQHDMVEVASGRARHHLVPARVARYVPWKRAKTRAALWAAPRAATLPSHVANIAAPTGTSPTPESLLAKLAVLPPVLQFSRLTISPVTPAIHGSVTLGDVQERLATEHGLTAAQIDVTWVGQDAAARMKELGTWGAMVAVRGLGREEVGVEVEVVREA